MRILISPKTASLTTQTRAWRTVEMRLGEKDAENERLRHQMRAELEKLRREKEAELEALRREKDAELEALRRGKDAEIERLRAEMGVASRAFSNDPKLKPQTDFLGKD